MSVDNVKSLTIRLPVPLYKKLGHHAIDHDSDLSSVVQKALEEFFKKEGK